MQNSNNLNYLLLREECKDISIPRQTYSYRTDYDFDDLTLDPLITYAIRNDNIELFNHLIKVGANLEQRNSYKSTPLIVAANKLEYIKILIENGANGLIQC